MGARDACHVRHARETGSHKSFRRKSVYTETIYRWRSFAPMRKHMEQVEVVREMIRQHGIPRSTVARLSGLWLTDLSAWLNGRQDLAADRVARVMETVADIAKVIESFP